MIVDANVAVRWYLDGPFHDIARSLLDEALFAPDLIISECLNGLWKAVAYGAGHSENLVKAAEDLPSRFDGLVMGAELCERAAGLAAELSHPVYDCMYLALAEKRGEPVITDDRKLIGKVTASSRHAHLVLALGDLA